MEMLASITKMLNWHFCEIKILSDYCFGENYITNEQIELAVNGKNCSVSLINNNIVCGFCLAYYNNNQLINTLPKQIIKLIDNKKWGIIKSICIKSDYRGKSYGSKMLAETVNMLRQNGAQIIIYPSWNQSCPEYFNKKLENNNFKNVLTIPNYWYTDSLKKGYRCIKCGQPPCKCSVSWYVLVY